MRLFAAIELDEAVRRQLLPWAVTSVDAIDSRKWRIIDERLWHLTLSFYGDVNDADCDALIDLLTNFTSTIEPFSLKLNGFGLFPKRSSARVFWAGCEEIGMENQLSHLARCCRRVEHATVRRRRAREAPFRAHVSVARSRGRGAVVAPDRLGLVRPPPECDWRVDRLVLYHSMLRPEGPHYRQLEIFELKGLRDQPRGTYV